MPSILQLHAAISEVAPIVSVSVGRWSDRSTWRIDFAAGVTPAERAAAAQVMASFDAAAQAPAPRDLAAEVDTLKAENEALKKALIDKQVIRQTDIEAAKPAVDLPVQPKGQ